MGGIDPNIILRLQQPQFERPRIQTPLEQFQKILTLKQLMQEGQLGELALKSKQEELAANQAMSELFRPRALTTAAPSIGLQPPAAAQPVSPDAYQEPNLMRPAGPEGRTPVTTAAFAPAGTAPVATTAFAPAGTPSVSSGLSGFPSAEALIAKGGRFAFPMIENLNKARKAELDQHVSALDLEKKESEATARLVNGITDDASLKQNLAILANKGKITWDDARRYSDLGFASPVTQNALKQNQLQSLDYDKKVELALKNAKEEREKTVFGQQQQEQERQEFAQSIQQVTDMKDLPAFLATKSPYIQQFYSGLLKAETLDAAKQRAALGAVKPEVGKTVAEPEAVQAGKIAVSAAQGREAAQQKLAVEKEENAGLLERVLADKTGKVWAGLSDTKQNQLAPEAARRGFQAWGAKLPTEAERKVFNFYSRAKDAADAIADLEAGIRKKSPAGQLVFEYGPNWMQSEQNQLYRQAQRQFTESRLRKESGAVISPSEFEKDRQTYFPQPGDTQAVLERKAKAREALLESMKTEAGNAYRQAQPEPATSTTPPARTSAGAAQAAPPGSWPVQVTKPGGKPEPMWMGPDGRTYELPPEPTIDTTKPSPLKPVGRYNPKTGKIEAIR